MRTSVSIPADIFEEAERLAAKLGVSRSELYARAVEAYVQQEAPYVSPWAGMDDAEITRRINESLAVAGPQKIDDAWNAAQLRVLEKEDW